MLEIYCHFQDPEKRALDFWQSSDLNSRLPEVLCTFFSRFVVAEPSIKVSTTYFYLKPTANMQGFASHNQAPWNTFIETIKALSYILLRMFCSFVQANRFGSVVHDRDKVCQHGRKWCISVVAICEVLAFLFRPLSLGEPSNFNSPLSRGSRFSPLFRARFPIYFPGEQLSFPERRRGD